MPVLSLSETDGRQYSSWSAALGGYSIAEGLGAEVPRRAQLGGALVWVPPKLPQNWRQIGDLITATK